MDNITLEWLEGKSACEGGIDYYETLGTTDLATILKRCQDDNQWRYIYWLLRNIFSQTDILVFNLKYVAALKHLSSSPVVLEALAITKRILEDPSHENRVKAESLIWGLRVDNRVSPLERVVLSATKMLLWCVGGLGAYIFPSPRGVSQTDEAEQTSRLIYVSTAIDVLKGVSV